ncbi:Uncharacterised protein [Burkholderia pseudomallei]|nr:Uncharacterised protein [Burkholderia pseudomallei]CAJ2868560.1 Uncharacterised protein [Burkholderia pseudomallei]CAJ3044720.1 Uncharacterised protein [Burkholderia pseudomallei]CAJ3298019.1 Uncharacterised protein [Burkholderia pseudomallei]CAJ3705273.1 Uncharacterised protein [Burkholderia pseudomallei]
MCKVIPDSTNRLQYGRKFGIYDSKSLCKRDFRTKGRQSIPLIEKLITRSSRREQHMFNQILKVCIDFRGSKYNDRTLTFTKQRIQ